MRYIAVHVGLPKTATSTLQQQVFPLLRGVEYPGRDAPLGPNRLHKLLRASYDLYSKGEFYKGLIDEWVSEIEQAKGNILISDEGFWAWRCPPRHNASPWATMHNEKIDEIRFGAHPLIEFLSVLREKLPQGIALRVIVTFRNQTDLLGSMAAQMEDSRSDFIDLVLESKDASLCFGNFVSGLFDTVGRSNSLVLCFEDGLEKNIGSICEFLGLKWGGEPHKGLPILNAKSAGQGQWRTAPRMSPAVQKLLKGIEKTRFGAWSLALAIRLFPLASKLVPRETAEIIVTPTQRRAIQRKFRDENEFLGSLIGRELSSLGY